MDSKTKYKVVFSKKALKDLEKLNPAVSQRIYSWIKTNLEGCEDPQLHGKALVGDHYGQWRYRVGDYRIICKIYKKEVIILVIEIGHRREIYD